jgi:hypothetical protein
MPDEDLGSGASLPADLALKVNAHPEPELVPVFRQKTNM